MTEQEHFDALHAALARVHAAGDPPHPRLRASWEVEAHAAIAEALEHLVALEQLDWKLDDVARDLVMRFRFVNGDVTPDLDRRFPPAHER